MARLPIPGDDDGTWGDILNDYLDETHDPDGSQKANTIDNSAIQDGAVTNAKISSSADIDQSKISNLTSDLAAKADDSAVVHDTGDETIAGAKTFSSEVTAPDFAASGITGATAASRYVGATASGAPVSGTFAVGDFVIDQGGLVWICTAPGSPGTWDSGEGPTGPTGPEGPSGITLGDRFVPGRYYTCPFINTTGASSGIQTNTFRCVPFYVGRTQSFDRISIYHFSNGLAGAVVRLAVYNDDGNGKPLTRAYMSDPIAWDSGAPAVREFSISLSLSQGLYWIGASAGSVGSGSAVFFGTAATNWTFGSPINGMSTPISAGGTSMVQTGYQIATSADATIPDPIVSSTSLGVTSGIAVVWLRAA